VSLLTGNEFKIQRSTEANGERQSKRVLIAPTLHMKDT
jgi:hypothetical protein